MFLKKNEIRPYIALNIAQIGLFQVQRRMPAYIRAAKPRVAKHRGAQYRRSREFSERRVRLGGDGQEY